MLLEETLTKLQALRMPTMAAQLRELVERPPGEQLSFEEKLGFIVDKEWTERENRRLQRRLKDAKLSTQACLENVHADPARGVDKAVMRAFATCQWVKAHQNIVIVGATGVGKSFLANALAQAACRHGHRALCVRATRLVHDLGVARADGTYTSLLGRLARIDVIVLDDFLIAPMKDTERRDLLEVLEDRYDRGSTVITSQLPTKNWHAALGEPTVADAICDRVVHNAHLVSLRGDSIRKKKGLDAAKD